jgi:ABC-type molybdate transport system substrate-binding protein
MAHNGLALSAPSRAAAGAAGAPTTCADVADFSQAADAAGDPTERASSGSASVAAKVSAEAPCDDNARTTMPIANLSTSFCLLP